jgi:glutaminyl-tRNA synthetase
VPFPEEGGDLMANLNPESLEVLRSCKLEPALASAGEDFRCQFLRHGYFYVDPIDSQPGAPVFNRTVTLKDTWAKLEARGKTG